MKSLTLPRALTALAASALLLAGCTGTPATTQTAGAGATGDGAASSYTIGVAQYVTHSSLDAAVTGFKEAIADAGLTVTYNDQNQNADPGTGTAIANTFRDDADIDLVLAVATPTAQAIAQVLTDRPVLFTAVTDPVAARLVDSLEAPGGNVTGTTDMNPVADQIALVKQIKPDAASIGIIYSSGEVNSEVQVEAARPAAEAEGLTVQEATVTNTAEVEQAVNSLNVDAIYVPTDNNVVSGLGSVIRYAEAQQIPVIAGEGDSVANGAVITYGLDYTELGRQVGEMAVAILTEGADPATMPVETQREPKLYVNEAAAARMGVTIPAELLTGAELVGS